MPFPPPYTSRLEQRPEEVLSGEEQLRLKLFHAGHTWGFTLIETQHLLFLRHLRQYGKLDS